MQITSIKKKLERDRNRWANMRFRASMIMMFQDPEMFKLSKDRKVKK